MGGKKEEESWRKGRGVDGGVKGCGRGEGDRENEEMKYR